MVQVKLPVYFYNRNGVYYFSRAVPSDLRHRFNKPKIEMSLRTKSPVKAKKLATVLSDRLERYWDGIRMDDVWSKELGLVALKSPKQACGESPSLDDALRLYKDLKGDGKNKLFFESADRSLRYLKDCLDHDEVADLTASDASKFRDYLFERGLSSSSVKRVFSSVRAITNLAAREYGLAIGNVFGGTFIPDRTVAKRRLPIPVSDINSVQAECLEIGDGPRLLIALISDTGMRLAEACGLALSDIRLDCEVPHIVLREHSWRRLKTAKSEREVPLVGASLEACIRVTRSESKFAFPKYCNLQGCNSNSASAALNKWLRPRVPSGCVIHSFRHSLRDRLRAIECPSDIVDQLGGWSTDGVGHSYGQGYSLAVKAKWLGEMVRRESAH